MTKQELDCDKLAESGLKMQFSGRDLAVIYAGAVRFYTRDEILTPARFLQCKDCRDAALQIIIKMREALERSGALITITTKKRGNKKSK